jgi:rubrerythrin
MSQEDKRRSLVRILQLAYSGERAAAYAYRGHWKSVVDVDERSRIKTIESEEWHHRELVGEMLCKLGSRPRRWRETKAVIIGRTLGFLCHLSGWLAPMYGAGKLESSNVKEYEAAARYARDCDRVEFIECLLAMAEVEWEHEKYFRAQVLKHSLARFLPIWQSPPPKETIRVSFIREGA